MAMTPRCLSHTAHGRGPMTHVDNGLGLFFTGLPAR